jgi:hypothetical protein
MVQLASQMVGVDEYAPTAPIMIRSRLPESFYASILYVGIAFIVFGVALIIGTSQILLPVVAIVIGLALGYLSYVHGRESGRSDGPSRT